MEEKRVKIADIAEELGLSTATVSNVIHGKTGKISAATTAKVQELLEKRGYIPSMAGILLAQNNSRIIGVVLHDHPKYEGHVLEDGFISSSLNALSKEIDQTGHFMMIKVTADCTEIIRFASMWNMDGLILIGFCEQDYQKLRESMHIPFVVYDGYSQNTKRTCNLTIDNYGGGYQAGQYLKRMGHEKVLCISDNAICMDAERIDGFKAAIGEDSFGFMQIPMQRKERLSFYQEKEAEILQYTAVFAVSDFYAVELIRYLQERSIPVPERISVMGFDDSPLCLYCSPTLTTIRQDADRRAKSAVSALQTLQDGAEEHIILKLPVSLMERKSVKNLREDFTEHGKTEKL
ncbi:MAG: LacI family transcriptional regulator [Lachnospiraceae bacterium]|nr:LacI family transcriptional regulator [Lachnospiraceae bacterium]